jgi:hypothetical protein
MEYIGKRISLKRTEKELSIVILSGTDKTKKLLLFLWFFLWSLSGVIVITQYFMIPDPDTKVAIIVWIGFWAYFEYRIFRAYMWRTNGMEKLKLRENKLFYKRQVAGRGKIHVYEFDFIKDLRIVEKKDTLMDNLNNSYWVIAGESIAFDYYGKEILFGLQLDAADSKALLMTIKKEMK